MADVVAGAGGLDLDEILQRSQRLHATGTGNALVVAEDVRCLVERARTAEALVTSQLGECIGCRYDDGPDEFCPHHGRSYNDMVEMSQRMITEARSERDAARAELSRYMDAEQREGNRLAAQLRTAEAEREQDGREWEQATRIANERAERAEAEVERLREDNARAWGNVSAAHEVRENFRATNDRLRAERDAARRALDEAQSERDMYAGSLDSTAMRLVRLVEAAGGRPSSDDGEGQEAHVAHALAAAQAQAGRIRELHRQDSSFNCEVCQERFPCQTLGLLAASRSSSAATAPAPIVPPSWCEHGETGPHRVSCNTICDAAAGGSCFTPWCRCRCHKEADCPGPSTSSPEAETTDG
jgi:hypothetical protein